jgi:hypothetical protein
MERITCLCITFQNSGINALKGESASQVYLDVSLINMMFPLQAQHLNL